MATDRCLRRLSFLVLFLGLGLTSVPAQADPSAGMPEVLFYDDTSIEHPFWVADHLIMDEMGQILDPSILNAGVKFVLSRLLQDPPVEGGCVLAENTFPNEYSRGRETVADVIHATDWVFTARVTGLKTGFYGVRAGTLVRIEPDRVFKGPTDRNYPHYVFMPVGELTLGPYQYCRKDASSADAPTMKDELLLMVNLWPINSGEVLYGDQSMIVTLPADRRISVPGQFKKKDRETMMLTKEAFQRKVEFYTSE